MFERFTQEARQVVVSSQDEARQLHHNFIGTEHLLLGLLDQEGSPTRAVLERHGLTRTTAIEVLRRFSGHEQLDAAALGTVGMLCGLSLLTAVALRRFTAAVDAIGTPFELCPSSPADCPAYDAATEAAVLTQLHTVFAGAAIAAGLAAVAALLLLREVRTSARS